VREGQLLALAAGLGVAGMALDSLLGATLQARYWCAQCHSRSPSRRAAATRRRNTLRGVRGLDNNAVNGVSTMLAAAAGVVAWLLR
jgi:uncharacterized membrane protein